jgi:uncharacterized membrane protein YkvA (DUF1232 family)
MASYYDMLKKEIEDAPEQYVYYLPEFYLLLCNVLKEDITAEEKTKVRAALAYLVLATDVIPEETFGSFGYTDDLFVCCSVLRDLLQKHGPSLFNRYWNSSENIELILPLAYEYSFKAIKAQNLIDKVLSTAGI